MIPKLIRFAKNPTVQKIAVWVGPLLLGWFMKKVEEGSSSKPKTTKKKR
jgi:hypothetical protein